MVLSGYTVRREQIHDLRGAESSVRHACKNLVHRVLRKRYQTVRRNLRVVGTSSEELETRATAAIADSDRTGELDARNAYNSVKHMTTIINRGTYKSPNETLCFRAKGVCSPTISSRPALAWNVVSMGKAMMEPSAPPPL